MWIRCLSSVCVAMNTLMRIRSTTRSLNCGFDGYNEPLMDRHGQEVREEDSHGRREFSKVRKEQPQYHNYMVHSLSYKRDRARKRRIFLKTYKLEKLGTPRPRKIRKMVVKKVKKAVVSVVSFMRLGSLSPCSCRFSIYTSSPLHCKCCWIFFFFFLWFKFIIPRIWQSPSTAAQNPAPAQTLCFKGCSCSVLCYGVVFCFVLSTEWQFSVYN